MPGKNVDKAKQPGGRDGATAAGRDRAERRAQRDERAAARGADAGVFPADAGLPFDGQSAWSAALHDGMAQGLGMREIMAEHNPGLFGPYVEQPEPQAAPDPLGGTAGANPLGALPPELAGMAQASPAGMPAFGQPPAAAPTATVNNFPQQPPMGGLPSMVPPGGGMAGMQQRRPGLPQGFVPNPMAGGTAPASPFARRRA